MNSSLSFFNFLWHHLKNEYPEEMTVAEFREVMHEVLKGGGIPRIEHEVNLSCYDMIEIVRIRSIIRSSCFNSL